MSLKEIALAKLKCMDIELRFNPWHDPKDGKFCSASGVAGTHVVASYKNNYGERVRRVYERQGADSDLDLKQIAKDYEEYKKQHQQALDNSDPRPYNGIKVTRDYNSDVAQTVGKAQYDTLCNDIEHCEDKNVARAYRDILVAVDCKLGVKSEQVPDTFKVIINPKSLTDAYREPGQTIEHEIGHAIDYGMSNLKGKKTAMGHNASYQTKNFGNTVKNESKAFVSRVSEAVGRTAGGVECCEYIGTKYGIQPFADASKAHTTDEFMKLTAGLSDSLCGYTGCSLGMSHSNSYYRYGGTKEAETFANVSQLILHGGKAETIFKAEMPETYKAVKDIYAAFVEKS